MYQFAAKLDNFDFFGPNLPKNEYWVQNFKNLSPDSESALPRYYAYQFSVKTDNFDFLAQISPKRKLGFEIQKNNVGIIITILEIPCVSIFRQNRQL